MQVVQGSLTKQQVTGIVNPTDDKLGILGGVSKRIARATGPHFKQDCQDLLADLPDGQTCVPVGSSVVMTYAGRLPCQYIIHTVGPPYHGELATPAVLSCSKPFSEEALHSKVPTLSVASVLHTMLAVLTNFCFCGTQYRSCQCSGWPLRVALQMLAVVMLLTGHACLASIVSSASFAHE